MLQVGKINLKVNYLPQMETKVSCTAQMTKTSKKIDIFRDDSDERD